MVNRTALDPQTPLGNVRSPLRGPFTRWPRAADTVLAIVLFLWVFLSFEDPNQEVVIRPVRDVPIAVYIVFAVASGALIWRRYQPLAVLAARGKSLPN